MTDLSTYEGTPVEGLVRDSVAHGGEGPLVYLMGPYRLLDPAYLSPSGEFTLPPDPLAPEGEVQADLIEATLRTVAERVTAATEATVFIATDVDIPTRREAAQSGGDEPGMAVIDQSVAFATASAGNAFVFTKAELTTGVGAETGTIPEYFDLRDPAARTQDPRTCCIFSEARRSESGQNTYEPVFSSASINEMDNAYDIRFRYFVDRNDLVEKLITFVESYVVPLAD